MGYGVDRNETADGSGAAVTPVQVNVVTAKGDLIAGTANAAVDNLAVGANETRLVADSTQATGLKYVADTVNYAVAAKGDLLVGTAADTVAPLTVGANNTILVADSAQASGAKWAVLAATDAIPGLVELATTAEVQTGTDTSRAVTPAGLQNGKIVLGTEQATTSGTTFDFTIPSWAKRVTVMFEGVSTGGTSAFLVQLGDAGGIEATGYISEAQYSSSGTAAELSSTAGFVVPQLAATNALHGVMTLTLKDSAAFTWMASGTFRLSATVAGSMSGSKSTSAAMTTVRLTTASGDTFDAGSVNVAYE